MKPTTPTLPTVFGDTPATMQAANMGDIMLKPFTGNTQVDDAYYELGKAGSGL